MDSDAFERITLRQDMIGEPARFLKEGMSVRVESYAGSPISVRVLNAVAMPVVEVSPVVKSRTAASSYMPAKLENGGGIPVPSHVASGFHFVSRLPMQAPWNAQRTEG
jgi:elongation factor P